MLLRSISIAAALTFASLAACSSDSDTGTTSGSSSGSTSSTGTGSGGGGGGESQTFPSGTVLADSDTLDGISSALVAAAFQKAAPEGCTYTVEGACKVVDCRKAKASAITSTYVNAGSIKVLGTDANITIKPNASNEYQFEDDTDQDWKPGAKVTVTSTGSADVPAFTVVAVAPPTPTLETPEFVNLNPITIPRSKDLELGWSGAAKGVAQAFFASEPPAGSIQLICSFDGAAGKGTVPSKMLEMLPPNTYVLTFRTAIEAKAIAGKYTITYVLATRGKSSKGVGAAGEVTVE